MQVISTEIKTQPSLLTVVLGAMNSGWLWLISQNLPQGSMKMACIALGAVNLLIAIGLFVLRFSRRPPP